MCSVTVNAIARVNVNAQLSELGNVSANAMFNADAHAAEQINPNIDVDVAGKLTCVHVKTHHWHGTYARCPFNHLDLQSSQASRWHHIPLATSEETVLEPESARRGLGEVMVIRMVTTMVLTTLVVVAMLVAMAISLAMMMMTMLQ